MPSAVHTRVCPRHPEAMRAHSESSSGKMETFNQVIAGLRSRDTSISLIQSDKIIEVDFAQLGELVEGNAEHFRSLGLRRGDTVAIALSTDVEHIVSFLALIALGALPVSIKPARIMSDFFVQEVERLCERFDVSYCYHTLPLQPRFQRIAWRANPTRGKRQGSAIVEAEPDDIVYVQFSSGSTQSPKPIPITHRNLMANLSTLLSTEGRNSDDTAFNFLPLSHDMGLIGGFLSSLVLQNSLLLTTPDQFLRRPIESFELAHSRNVGGMAMPDFALRYLSRMMSFTRRDTIDPGLFSQLRLIYCGAEPIRVQTIADFIQMATPMGLNPQSLFFCYGLAEATLIVSGQHFETLEKSFDRGPGSRPIAGVGPPLGDVEIRIAEADKTDSEALCPDEREGAIYLRGSSIFRGYWKGDTIPESGWFRTGDIGYLRGGRLYVSGREKEMIIVNGENLFPNDIENALQAIPDIRECLAMFEDEQLYLLVIPAPSTDLRTEAISSFICANFGITPRAVIKSKANHIVRTTSGKPMRYETLAAARQSGLLSD